MTKRMVHKTIKQYVILASRSPARRQLLREAGYDIGIAFPDVDEVRLPCESVKHYAVRVAVDKAMAVAKRCPNAIIIAVDTVIAHGGKIFGKPKTKTEAKRMLRQLSGRWHEVYSGTVILNAKTGKVKKMLVRSRVKFAHLSDKLIDWYIKTGEPFKAAGGYSIQKRGRILIESVDGCLTNIIGISVPVVQRMLGNRH